MRDEGFAGLPGADLVVEGLDDLRAGRVSAFSLLLLVAAPRLQRLGLEIPLLPVPLPYEHQLYALLETERGADAYSYYNSLIRRITSFSSCLERELSSRS